RERLPGVLLQRGLRVPRIDVRRPAIQEDMDDMLRLGREVGRSRRQRIDAGGDCLGRTNKVPKCQRPKAHSATLQQLAPGEAKVIELELVRHYGFCGRSPAIGRGLSVNPRTRTRCSSTKLGPTLASA